MGVVGCYSMDLYCDFNFASGNDEHDFETMPGQFMGATESECIRAARRRGWLITYARGCAGNGRGAALCPLHSGKRRKKRKPTGDAAKERGE